MKTPKPAAGPTLDLVDALVQLSFLVQSVLARLGAAQDLSLIQVRLLGVLRDRTPGMLELAGYLGLDKSSVTGLVDRAERRGLVSRSASETDGRALFVSLTSEGRILTETFGKEMKREIKRLAGGLSQSSRAHFIAIAGQILADAAAARSQ